MTDNPPISKEVKEFNFKLKGRLKLFEQLKIHKPANLLAPASKYGVIFAGTPTGVQCIQTESIFSLEVDPRPTKNVTSYPRRNLQLGVQPSHLSVSADCELLAVTLVPSDCAVLFVYSVASFGSLEVLKKCEVRLSSTPGVTVSDLQWNPGMANVLAVVMTDGSAAVIEFKDLSFNIVGSIPQNSQASCLCWSPKGKQVVIGAKNGSLTQYKPELKAVKTFPPPQIQGTPGLSVISVHWLSSFQFIAVYRCSSDPSARANVMVVNVPKGSPTKYVNYEDLCYGSNTSRPEHYFIHQPAWNLLIVGTTNSMEANVLGMEGDNWVQWMLDDGGRAELPLTDNHQDVYNIGMGFDISPSQPVPIGENVTIDPMPLLVMLSHDGVLCFFQAINNLQGAPKICQAPQPFPDPSGLHLFNLPEAGDASLISSSPKEETKASIIRGPGEQQIQVQAIQPSAPSNVSSSSSLGKLVLGQVALGQGSLGQVTLGQSSLGQGVPPFSMSPSFGQPSSGQSISFSQPSFVSTSANPPVATPISKFSLTSHSSVGQPSSPVQSGLSFGGLGLSQPSSQTQQQPTFSSTGSLSQLVWPTEVGQRISPQKSSLVQPSAVPPKQSSPVQPSVIQPQLQLQQASFSLPQSNSTSQQSVSSAVTTQPLPNSQHTSSPSQSKGVGLHSLRLPSPGEISPSLDTRHLTFNEGTTLNQVPAIPNSQPVLNKLQPNQVNRSPQSQSQGSPNSQLVPTSSDGQPSGLQPQLSKLAPVAEVEEEPDEKEILKGLDICQELLHNFSIEIEQKQETIKYISAQTEYNIGESKLKDQIIQEIESLRKLEEELTNTGMPDQSDINAVGSNVLEIFGWYEKIKAKERMAKNPGYIELMESQDLDPITKNYLNNIDKYVYYLESQIKQAKSKLSSLWDNIGSPNFEIPVMEVIYQSLIAQMNVLAAKKAVVDSCEAKMKKFNKNRTLRNSRRYVGDLELSTLAERLLDTRISDTDLLQDTSIRDASNNYIMLSKRIAKKHLNEDKVGALHQWHKNHKVITTKVIKKSAVVNSDFSKDETFYRIISPSKQSTPYHHATPKKSTSSIPRKSLFTLTSNMTNGHLETSQVGLSTLEIQQNASSLEKQADSFPSIKDHGNKTKFESNFPDSSVDTTLINNLSVPVSKVVEGNKIDGIQDTSNFSTALSVPGVSDPLNNMTTVSSVVSKEAIPTPAAFKSVPPQHTTKGKSESIVSTSWGSQTPVFSQSFFSSANIFTTTKGLVSTSSVSIFSGSLSSSGQVTSSSAPLSSFSFNLSGTAANQTSSSAMTKSIFSRPIATSANSLFFSANQKAGVSSSSSSTEKECYEPIVTTVTALYTPTPIKLSTSSATPFSFSSSSNSGEANVSPVVRTTTSGMDMNSSLSVRSSNQPGDYNPPTTTSTNSILIHNLPSSTSITPVTLVDETTSSISSNILSKTKTTSSLSETLSTSPVAVVVTTSSLSSSTQLPESSQAPNTSQAAIFENSVSDTENDPKTNVITWTGGSMSVVSGQPETSPSTTTASLFAGSSLFGSPKPSVPATQSIFGGTSVFSSVLSDATTPVLNSASVTTNTTNVFGTASVTPTSSIFGSANTITSAASSSSVSSTATTSASAFTSSVTSSASSFGTTAASTSVSISGTSTVTTAPLFGSPQTVSSSVFASPVASSSSASPFGATTITAVAPIFGSTTTVASGFSSTPVITASSLSSTSKTTLASDFSSTSTTTASGFSSTSAITVSSLSSTPTTTSVSIFGDVHSTPSSAFEKTTSVFSSTAKTTASIFGASTTSASFFGSGSVFGAAATTMSSVFGSTNTATTSSVFGAANTTTAPSVFGAANTTTAPSVFGGTNTTTTSSVFGSTSVKTTSSAFGSPSTQGNSIFGATSALSSTSFFGSPTTSSSFGNQSPASIFGGSSSFGTPSTTNSFFGKAICSPTSTATSVFGSTSNVFGATTTTSASSIFGGSSFQQKQPSFGQTTGSVFGQTTSSGGNFGTSGGSLFGGTPSFGSPSAQGNNIFQSGGTGNIFGGAASTSPFSGAAPAASQPAFGSPPSFQSAQRPFGTAAPVFGGQSTFGASPTFGGSPTFGSSPGKVFGTPAVGSAPTFGSPTQQSSTFENLANQDTLSFGNLAQQQTFPTTSFGGSSFSSWRS